MIRLVLQRFRRRPSISATALLPLSFALAACGARTPAGTIEPGVEQQAVAATMPAVNRFVAFDWTLVDGGSRFRGAGAARIANDMRARLDLFGPQDVLYLSAILRDDRLTMPPGVPARVVPPAPLLWASLGVIRPPTGSEVLVAEVHDGETRLVYRAADGTWTFRARGGALVHAEWQTSAGARHTVELTGSSAGAPPQHARYRDWQEYRELVLELEQQEEVDAFPPETWSLEPR
ncbi:MAG TPA: hypothetical protein VF039_04055 [Longimicrobiales bacterium]